ncbi:hypothetical protein MR730_02155 [bacterium]|nr:hypothetical protein [bacterium]
MYQRLYQADRRAAEKALNRTFNQQYARERREKLTQAKEAFDHKRTAH